MYRIWYTTWVGKKPKSFAAPDADSAALEREGKRVPAIFFRTEAGGEPVRDWLKGLPPGDRGRIGEGIKNVGVCWAVGVAGFRALGDGIYEVRTSPPPTSNRERKSVVEGKRVDLGGRRII